MARRTAQHDSENRNTADGRRVEQQAENHRRTRKAHLSEIAEDYVEVIAELIEANGEARAVDIARRLGVTHVTVVKTIARLVREELVSSKPYRSIFLTDAGRDLAEKARHRHQIVVQFLKSLGVSDAVANADAEGIEHHVSAETLHAFEQYCLKANSR